MIQNKFKGTGVAIITPFLKNRKIDFSGLSRLLKHIIEGGVDYIVVLGTTGESVVLNQSEKNEVLAFVRNEVDGKKPLVVGVGGNNTSQVISDIECLNLNGYDAILSVSPYYNKPTQEGIYQHYKMISKSSDLPVILYNVPSRTGSNIEAETTLRLANDCENIIAIKEASGNMNQIMKIIQDCPENFLVISGDDALTLSMIQIGGDGVISVLAQAYPKEFSNMVRFSLEDNQKIAKELHFQLYDLLDPLYSEGNPAGIKAALKIMGICENYLRLPLVQVSNQIYQNLETLINKK